MSVLKFSGLDVNPNGHSLEEIVDGVMYLASLELPGGGAVAVTASEDASLQGQGRRVRVRAPGGPGAPTTITVSPTSNALLQRLFKGESLNKAEQGDALMTLQAVMDAARQATIGAPDERTRGADLRSPGRVMLNDALVGKASSPLTDVILAMGLSAAQFAEVETGPAGLDLGQEGPEGQQLQTLARFVATRHNRVGRRLDGQPQHGPTDWIHPEDVIGDLQAVQMSARGQVDADKAAIRALAADAVQGYNPELAEYMQTLPPDRQNELLDEIVAAGGFGVPSAHLARAAGLQWPAAALFGIGSRGGDRSNGWQSGQRLGPSNPWGAQRGGVRPVASGPVPDPGAAQLAGMLQAVRMQQAVVDVAERLGREANRNFRNTNKSVEVEKAGVARSYMAQAAREIAGGPARRVADDLAAQAANQFRSLQPSKIGAPIRAVGGLLSQVGVRQSQTPHLQKQEPVGFEV